MKKLLIKASGITNPSWRGYNSGVGRSTFLLLDAISKMDNIPFEIGVYVNGLSSLGYNFNNWPFKHYSFPVPEEYGCHKTHIESLFRKYFIKNDLFHIPHNLDSTYKGEKYVVTLHDVIRYDEAFKEHNTYEMNKWLNMTKNARGVVTCSNYSKNEIVNKLNVDPDKVSVIYWGISENKFYRENIDVTRQKLAEIGIDFPYFVSVSCAHPRKNVRTLLKAYREFAKSQPQHRLVLVWGNPPVDILNEYSKEISEKKIIFLSYVSDETLLSLYNGASVTLFPTLSEGFGFPILESFACGTPVMTCRNTSLPEVGGDVALYVGENDIDEMVDVMRLFENMKYDTEEFNISSKRLLHTFSWEHTASEYIKFYNRYL